MCARFVGLLIAAGLLLTGLKPVAAEIPAGYKLVYSQDFTKSNSIGDFKFTDPNVWQLSPATNGVAGLELFAQSKYEPPVRAPFNLALIDKVVVGDFVLEADMLQTSREYPHRDMVAAFGIRDTSHQYYVHLASAADEHANNIFIVNGAPRQKIATSTTSGVKWGVKEWRHVRIERVAATGSIRVFFNDMTTPVMIAEDKTFQEGWIALGSFDDTGLVSHIRVWAPSVKEEACSFWKQAVSR